MDLWTESEFCEALREGGSIAEILRTLHAPLCTTSYRNFHQTIEALDLDASHLPGTRYGSACLSKGKPLLPLEEMLVRNSPHGNNHLKHRLLQEGVLKEKCSECGQGSVWRGNPLILQLDHKNGDGRDNRLENLRLLCPNCHTQTPTWCGKKFKREAPVCRDCGTPVVTRGSRCRNCALQNRSKIQWPAVEALKEMVDREGYREVARSLGVSDNAVRKHLKRRL